MTAEQLAAVRAGSYLVAPDAGQLIRNLCAEIENYQSATGGLLERVDAVRAERDAELRRFEKKKAKLRRFMDYSRRAGCLDGPPLCPACKGTGYECGDYPDVCLACDGKGFAK